MTEKPLIAAVVGNPNCGKTTLFNALTGARQRVGNWAGVTVERKSGFFTFLHTSVEVVDLPGVYALTLSKGSAVDEQIACRYILDRHADCIINIVDASQLERNFYLTLQLLEMGVPVIIALNMMDVARAQGFKIDIAHLAKELGCPVIPLSAHQGEGINALKQAIVTQQVADKNIHIALRINYPQAIVAARDELIAALKADDHLLSRETCREQIQKDFGQYSAKGEVGSRFRGNDSNGGNDNISRNEVYYEWLAIRLLEDDACAKRLVNTSIHTQTLECQKKIRTELQEDPDILLADARYRFIQQILNRCVFKSNIKKVNLTSWIDKLVLNRVLGIPIFLGVMYLLFFFSINIGGAFQDFFDISSETICVNGLSVLLNYLSFPTWLIAIIANGIGKGINTTITFIPVIGAMFLFLAFLEDSGYMARAAFVVDRLMRALGLPGKAFVPMIVGFGCNVPAVMAARTLENKGDRILTIMMAPFMSCGARLAIFAIFTAAFFPKNGQNIIFGLYLIGILTAIFTGFILRKTLLKGDVSPLIMELPPYHKPHIKTLLLHTWHRLSGFVIRAGKIIIPICVLIGVLNSINVDGSMNAGEGDARSILSSIGQWITPIFTPMGITRDNWPATVGLVTGILAKEVVIGTLNSLYVQVGHFATSTTDAFSFWGGLQEAFHSIPENFAALKSAFYNPVLAKAPLSPVTQGVYGLMYQKFDGKIGAFAYLLFVLLYFPCISTTAAMLRELHKGWSIFSLFWTTGLAYGIAVIFYQAATFARHPYLSLTWILSLLAIFFAVFWFVRFYAAHTERHHEQQELTMGET